MRLQIADKSVIGSVRFKIETRQPRNPEKRHGVATPTSTTQNIDR